MDSVLSNSDIFEDSKANLDEAKNMQDENLADLLHVNGVKLPRQNPAQSKK